MDSTGYVFVTPELSPCFKITGIGDLLQNIIGELARRNLRVAVICPDFGVDPRRLRFTKSMSIYSTSNGQPTSLQVKFARDDRGVDYFIIKDGEIQRYLSEASSLRRKTASKAPGRPGRNGWLRTHSPGRLKKTCVQETGCGTQVEGRISKKRLRA
ncbi:MAG: glycogen/starch synthase [Desulfobaccales bacterium]